jgi:ankyrin repeat protein
MLAPAPLLTDDARMLLALLLTASLVSGQGVAAIDAEDATQLTQLMRAAARGDLKAVERLLDQKADPNVRSSGEHLTALMFAAYHGHTAVAKALVAKGARLDLKDDAGAAAVDWAAFADHKELAKLLSGKGAALNPFLNVGTLPLATMEKAAATPQ